MLDRTKSMAGPFERVTPAEGRYVRHDPPRPLTDWVIDGAVVKGSEANGTVFRYEHIEALNAVQKRGGVCEYLVAGEWRYTDGRVVLDVGMNPAWIEANTDFRYRNRQWTWACPDCDGTGDEHRKITIPDPDGGRPMTVKCPRDTKSKR